MTDNNNTGGAVASCNPPADPGLSPDHHPNTDIAAQNMAHIAKFFGSAVTAKDMLLMLRTALRNDGDGSRMLFNQALALDILFHRLSITALTCSDEDGNPIYNYVNREMAELALRTQKQCRTTMDAIRTFAEQERYIGNLEGEPLVNQYRRKFKKYDEQNDEF